MAENKLDRRKENLLTIKRMVDNGPGYEKYFDEKSTKIELRPDVYEIAQECLKLSFIKLGMIAGGNARETDARSKFESTDFLAAKELAKLAVELLKVCGNKPRKKDDETTKTGSWSF